ncbi:MAG: transcription antitermination factor NusB [Limnochordia bacterium]
MAVDQAVELAKIYGHRGTASLVNGVLRSFLRKGSEPVPSMAEDPALSTSPSPTAHPRWLVERWVARFGADFTASLCRANNEPAPTNHPGQYLNHHEAAARQRPCRAGN